MFLLVKPADGLRLLESRADGAVLFEITRDGCPDGPVATLNAYAISVEPGATPTHHLLSSLAVRFGRDGALVV